MSIPEIKPETNGRHEAPLAAGGAFAMEALWEAPATADSSPSSTTFPPPSPSNSLRTLLYGAYRHEVGGATPTRWLFLSCLLLALLWAVGIFPGRWTGTVIWSLLALSLGVAVTMLRRQDFIRFYDMSLPDVKPKPLSAADKCGVYVTGRFEVEGRAGRFTSLPGFYRTFATREHALLCVVQESRFANVARWPIDEIGMWYVFFTPDQIAAIRVGKLHFDRALRSAVAIDRTIVVAGSGRFRRPKEVSETIYIVPVNPDDTRRILADILVDLPTPPAANSEAHQRSGEQNR